MDASLREMFGQSLLSFAGNSLLSYNLLFIQKMKLAIIKHKKVFVILSLKASSKSKKFLKKCLKYHLKILHQPEILEHGVLVRRRNLRKMFCYLNLSI